MEEGGDYDTVLSEIKIFNTFTRIIQIIQIVIKKFCKIRMLTSFL